MLTFDQVSHHFDDVAALSDVSFSAAAGEVTCLVGTSGCGKTTLLRITAGLLRLQAGSIALDGQALPAELPPERRPIGLVFQEGALFPHLNVAQNVGFGLPRADRGEAVSALLAQVHLDDLGDRLPHALSGGQRQRVGLARALARTPRALLFDEPYANLDVALRRRLRDDARRAIRERDTVGLFVTHDPEEVMAIADKVVVLEGGRVSQQGAPGELYDRPATLQVAAMFGRAQRLRGTMQDDALSTPFGRWPRECLVDEGLQEGPMDVVVRAQDLRLSAAQTGPVVVEIRRSDDALVVHLEAPNAADRIEVLRMRDARPLAPGDCVSVTPIDRCVFAAPKPLSTPAPTN
ncbi:MAG: ABC transporter ATP-binding protein [Pseudomonadota bacterium]